jgi:tetratricopeptide (TPR) repeat protein
LFFAAKTLAENNRNQAALKKYALFPENAPQKLAVLLNMAELYAENGENAQALHYARKGYELAPDLPEAQFCYADKLCKNGRLTLIPDVIRFSGASSYRREMKNLWIAGMEERIKICDPVKQREKVLELCRQLLAIASGNKLALEYLKKLDKMPQ